MNKKAFAWVVAILLIAGSILGGLWWIKTRPIVNEYVIRLRDEQGKQVEFQYGSIPSLTNPDYYKNVRQQLIDSRADFIDADLASMQLVFYKQGSVTLEVPIKAKGKIGTWFQTPSGLYKAEQKQANHRSSFEPVNMKWNIPFQGNYFIHGWPTYVKTGKPVTSDDSAGCIRLSDEDAKKVYDLASISMPILIHELDVSDDSYSYNVNIPELSGKSYLAADLSNNFVFLEKGQNDVYPLADITKYLNAFVVSEYMNFDTPVTATKDMLIASARPRLIVKQKYTPYDLIFPMILENSNEAAEALSRPLGKINFVAYMNRKAKSLGMINTTIAEPTGATAQNITTPHDVFQLVQSLQKYRSFILTMNADLNTAMIYGPSKFKDLKSYSPFAQTEGFSGGMITSGSQASTTLQSAAAVFTLDFKGQKRNIAIMSFDSERASQDIEAMKVYIERVYK